MLVYQRVSNLILDCHRPIGLFGRWSGFPATPFHHDLNIWPRPISPTTAEVSSSKSSDGPRGFRPNWCRAIFLGGAFYFGHVVGLLFSCVPLLFAFLFFLPSLLWCSFASFLLCFSTFLFLRFIVSPRIYFFASLLLCFTASQFLRISASLLLMCSFFFCVSAFPALLLRFSNLNQP